MDQIVANGRRSPLGLLANLGQAVVLCAALGGVAVAGGGAPGATPTPTPATQAPQAVRPVETPTPAPTPTPTPLPGDPEIAWAQERLAELGYWVGPVDGEEGPSTHHAVMAFQKVEGLGRDGRLGPQTLEALRTASPPSPKFPGPRHVEIDLSRQVLFFVDGHSAHHILPVSSGSGKLFTSQGWTRRAVTPRGRFSVQRKISGWRVSPLGKLYYPNYIVGGIAIHGAPSVPAYPASHGCIRIPMFAATEASAMLSVGSRVIVHSGGAVPQETDVTSPPGLDTPDASKPASPEPTVTPRPPRTPSPDGTPTPTPEPTPSPSATSSPAPEPTRTPEPTPKPTPEPTPTPAEDDSGPHTPRPADEA